VDTFHTSLTETDLREVERAACRAALSAGTHLSRVFGRVKLHVKAAQGPADYRRDFVTRADLAAERTILAVLNRCRLRASVVSEERSPVQRSSPFTWVVDPLDGTANFATGVPYFAVSIALFEHRHPIVAAVLDPLRGDLFSAVIGGGVKVNGSSPRRRARPSGPLVLFGLGRRRREAAASLRTAVALLPSGVFGLRMLGSAALDLAAVAAGTAEVFYHRSVSSWDIAAGVLLVREAGGTVLLSARDAGRRRAGAHEVDLSRPFRGAVLACRGSLSAETMKPLLAIVRG
jgi:myo-inositol-1(or 4)-monophosphatase